MEMDAAKQIAYTNIQTEILGEDAGPSNKLMFLTDPDLAATTQPLHKIAVVNQLAQKLNIPMTSELLLMSNTDEISEKLISIAMANGTDAKVIDKALDSVSK